MKLGLFGGTFDPVHNAHLYIAEAARASLQLERIVFLPAGGAHYRPVPFASIDDRLAMLRGAIAGNPGFALDTIDLDAAATGYTADLLPRLRSRYPDAQLTFIAGGDSLIDSPWQRFEGVLAALDSFAIAPRAHRSQAEIERYVNGLPVALQTKMQILELPALNASATMVRDLLARGASIRYLVPESVARYIAKQGLYRAPLAD